MRIVSIDLETTGLDPDSCQIIEFGAVIETVGTTVPVDDLPWFHAYVVRETYCGEPYALAMHSAIFKRIASREGEYRFVKPEKLAIHFRDWLTHQGFPIDGKTGKTSINATGKNYGSFDSRFLAKLDEWGPTLKVAHRVLDPGSLYFRPGVDDQVPDTKECLIRAGLDPQVPHDAIGDARNVIRLLRRAWYGM